VEYDNPLIISAGRSSWARSITLQWVGIREKTNIFVIANPQEKDTSAIW
jgi:hypothetical protein